MEITFYLLAVNNLESLITFLSLATYLLGPYALLHSCIIIIFDETSQLKYYFDDFDAHVLEKPTPVNDIGSLRL